MEFTYEAVDLKGQSLFGEIEASSKSEVVRILHSRNLKAITVESTEKKSKLWLRRRASSKEILISLHEMVTLLESGVSVSDVIEAQAKSDYSEDLSQSYRKLAADIRRGSSFSKAFEAANFKVPNYMHVLAEAGEVSGSLGKSLREGVNQLEFEIKLQRDFQSALLYPSFLIVFGLAAILFVFVFVVPRFSSLLKNGSELPWLSEIVLSVGLFVANNSYAVGLFIFSLIGALILVWRRPGFRQFTLTLLERLPIIGVWLTERDVANWSSLMSALLSSKSDLVKSLDLSAKSMRSAARRARMEIVIKDVRSGKSLADALEKNRVLTPAGYNLVRSGEKTGKVDFMVKSLAELYSEGVKKRMEDVLALVEPTAILLIGGVIGTTMIGVILAMTSINDVF